MLVCTARIVDEAEFKKIRRKLYKQYPKYESAARVGPEDSVIVELTPQSKFGWALGSIEYWQPPGEHPSRRPNG